VAIGHFGWFWGVLGMQELLAMNNGALFAAPIPESRKYRSIGGTIQKAAEIAMRGAEVDGRK